jgi:TctA family transporter
MEFLVSLELWERSFFDFWAIPHFLFGFIAFYLLQKFDFKKISAFVVTIILAILWEFFEIYIGVVEQLSNRFADVFWTFLALIILISLKKNGFKNDKKLFWWSFAIFWLVTVLGWTAFFFREFYF